MSLDSGDSEAFSRGKSRHVLTLASLALEDEAKCDDGAGDGLSDCPFFQQGFTSSKFKLPHLCDGKVATEEPRSSEGTRDFRTRRFRFTIPTNLCCTSSEVRLLKKPDKRELYDTSTYSDVLQRFKFSKALITFVRAPNATVHLKAENARAAKREVESGAL